MKTYTNRSNARRAAITNLFNQYKNDERVENVTKDAIRDNFDALCFVYEIREGEFVPGQNDDADSKMLELFESKMDKELRECYGTSTCPHCGIHLSNGITTDQAQQESGLPRNDEFEYCCLACNHEWGPKISKRKAAPRKPKQKDGIKIEKNRETQNGVTRPSTGGVCAEIWDFCDNVLKHEDRIATAKDLRAAAELNGWDQTTTRIQMYKWRKFQGISGRV